MSLPALLALLLITLGVASPELLGDGDTLWHVAAGRWIIAHAAIPHQDPFSFSMAGAPWTAHEWLAEWLFAQLDARGGLFAVQAAAAVSFGVTGAIMLRFALARLEPMRALLLSMIAVGLCASHLLARPHVLTWPLVTWWTAMLFSAVERGHRPPAWSLLLVVLWANLHGSAPLALIIAGAAALDAVWEAAPSERRACLWRWAGFLAAVLIALCVTPWGPLGLVFTVKLSSMKGVLAFVNEWQSANFQQPQVFELWILLMLALLASGRVRLSPPRVLLLALLVHFALASQRHHATLGLIFAFLLAAPLARAWPVSDGAPRSADARWWQARARHQSAMGQVGTVLLTLLLLVGASRTARATPPETVAPTRALAFARRAGLTGHVFNGYNFGGFLIEQGIPVFIDGRTDMYGTAFMETMARAVNVEQPGALEQLLDRHAVTWTLLAPSTPAAQYLDHLTGWTRRYQDEFAVIHTRNAP